MNQHPTTGHLLLDVSLEVGASGSPILYQNKNVVGIMVRTTNISNQADGAIGIAHPITAIQEKLTQWQILN